MHKQIFEKGDIPLLGKDKKKISLHAQLSAMGDNPRRFQYHPLKTVGGVGFTRIC